ncbi:MAG TPA: hypothetical protein VLX59_11410, partial [Acidimicrobiales bacterium]|nr:hypothetical protein [Acidimicrobiales bacterium]
QVVANDLLPQVDGGSVADRSGYRLAASPAQFDERPPSLRRAPEHGEHTEEILLETGRTWDDIATLRTRGAIP